VSKDLVVILTVAFAGFLIGGAYTTWKTARTLAIVLVAAALLAAAGALAWLVS
jgi:hypothetical protein